MHEQAEGPVFITIKDAAKMISVTPRFLWSVIHKGKGPPVKYLNSRGMRVHKQTFIRWFETEFTETPKGKR